MKDTRLNISIIICMFMPRKYGKSFLQEMAILVKLLKLSRDIKKSIDTAIYKEIAVNNKIVFTRSAIYDSYMATPAYRNVFFLILAQFFLLTKTKFYEKFSAMDECDECECFY